MTYELNLFQILKSIRDVKLSGYYYAKYNFMDEVVGASGVNIDYITTCVGTAVIITDYLGHKKVLHFSDDTTGTIYHHYDENKISGTMEFYLNVVLGVCNWRLEAVGGSLPVVLHVYENYVRFFYGDGFGGSLYTQYQLVDEFSRFRIDFDCVKGVYSGWCDDNLIVKDVPFDKDLVVDYIFRENIYAGAEFELCYDAVDHSWNLDYNVGDNRKQILYLIREVIKRDGKMSI